MRKNSRIFVSGHAGMVGKTLCQLLKKEGYKNVITRTSKELDLCNQLVTEKFFLREKPEYVFHLAAKVGGIMANIKYPADFSYNNIIISTNIINSSHKYGVKKLLNLGSACAYPKKCLQPIKERYLMGGPLEPSNEGYALAKIIAVKLCEYYNMQHKTDYISLLPCNIYGINDKFDSLYSHVIPALIMKIYNAKIQDLKLVSIWGTGKVRKEFIYVEDVAKACLYVMENYSAKDLKFSYLNLGSGADISLRNLVEKICRIIGYYGDIKWDKSKPEGIQKRVLDISKLKQLNFNPTVGLEEGIRKTYDYYLKTYNK